MKKYILQQLHMTNNNNICPKCSSNMVKHPSLLSMPFASSQKMMTTTTDDDNATKKVNIEDQDANFTFRFYSCSKCGYTEFYLADKGKRI
jgi:ribosomal protein S27AE